MRRHEPNEYGSIRTPETENNLYKALKEDAQVVTGADDDSRVYDSEIDQPEYGQEKILTDNEWLAKAQQMYTSSSHYMHASLEQQWSRNIANFQSRHPAGSKYHLKAYEHRSKGFQPKTRSAVRRNEAACVGAFFSTADLVSITAVDDSNEMQRAAADLLKQVVEYRLKKTIPWLLTLVGAYQDTMVSGICISRQRWDYSELPDGTVVKDQPVIDMIPPENFRFSPSCDWRDVVESSPYLIHLIPMTVGDVRTKMVSKDGKTGNAAWNTAQESHIRNARESAYNITRKEREGNRTDSHDVDDVPDHEMVWAHRYIVRHEGEDWEFYTLGTAHMLTTPRKLKEMGHGGWRDYVIGFSVIETHKTNPPGFVELGQNLQAETNDIQNQRRDNVALAVNGRYLYRRGANIDLQAMMKSVPGGGIATQDPTTDIKPLETRDVTSSSYEEQNRLNTDFDEIVGTFSQGSVSSNRALNETVGGMEMLNTDANIMTEYALRIFSSTYAEKVLYQILRLEQMYETDAVILALAAGKADLYEEYKIDQITPKLLKQDLNLELSIGTDSTNPTRAAERLMYAVTATTNIGASVNAEEVSKEIYGKMGYQSGDRFMEKTDQVPQEPPVDQVAMAKIEIERERLQFDMQVKQAQMGQEREMRILELALQERITIAQVEAKLTEADQNNQTARDVQAAKSLDLSSERAIKITQGSGI